MRIKRSLAAFLSICLCVLAVGISPSGTAYAGTASVKSMPAGYQTAAENSRFALGIDEACLRVMIQDKKTGMVWKSDVTDGNFDIESVNKKFQSRIRSPFEISYTDLKKGYGAVITNSLASLEYTVKQETVNGGVKLLYDLIQPQIRLSVEYRLLEDGFSVTLPAADFEEYGSYSVTGIRVLPFFGSAMDKTDGYFFYPDGSGAVMEFSDISHVGESEMILNIYGKLESYEGMLGQWKQGAPDVMLPVFGAGIEKNGFLAVVTKGSEAAQIKLQPTNSVIPVNSLNCEFTFRRSYSDLRVADQSVKIFDREYIDMDRSISYFFLDHGKNTYSDMAVRYRSYLLENGMQKRGADPVSLSVDLFMGIKEKGMLFDVFKAVTTFDEARTILSEMKQSGIRSIDAQLSGWMKNGYGSQPVLFPAAGKLGGSSGLLKLAEFTKEQGITLSLKADVFEARSKNKNFSTRNDVVYLGNHAILTNHAETKFLLSPDVSRKNFSAFLAKAKEYPIDGVEAASVGRYLPYNYNEKSYLTAADTRDLYVSMMESAGKALTFVSAEGGNAYLLPYVDRVTGIPDSDTGLQLTTKAVPFFQTALHGLVEYTGTAGNLSSDLEKEKLKWIELGYVPYYELTFEGSEKLMYTDYNRLFTSTYTDWLQTMADVYREFEENLSGIWSETIERHEEIAALVYKVTYSNGTVVYVNYNKEEASDGSVRIPARGYAVKEEKR